MRFAWNFADSLAIALATSLTKLGLVRKTSICSAIKENPLLYCCMLSVFGMLS